MYVPYHLDSVGVVVAIGSLASLHMTQHDASSVLFHLLILQINYVCIFYISRMLPAFRQGLSQPLRQNVAKRLKFVISLSPCSLMHSRSQFLIHLKPPVPRPKLAVLALIRWRHFRMTLIGN